MLEDLRQNESGRRMIGQLTGSRPTIIEPETELDLAARAYHALEFCVNVSWRGRPERENELELARLFHPNPSQATSEWLYNYFRHNFLEPLLSYIEERLDTTRATIGV